jgi:hypothetical protein
MSTENTVDKVKLISELKEIHSELFQVYKKLFDFKYKHDETFKIFIDNEYKENGVGSKEQKAWDDNFCHRASYTLLNKILFVRICEDKGFMRNAEDYIAGEVKDPHIGEKLSKVGLQKWGRLITNYTLGELIKFAFNDMRKSYSNIVLYKEDKYEILNLRDVDFNLKYIDGDEDTKNLVLEFESGLNNIIEKLDTNNFNFKYTDGNILGDVYEKFMDRETRKAIGQFYTPEFVIENILRNTVEKVNVVETPFVTIADISCGSGHFLIMAYDILRKKFFSNLEKLREKYAEEIYTLRKDGKEVQLTGREYWIKEHIHYHILKYCIYGADIDSFAVQLTTINLLLKDLDNFTDELNIIECDSLIKWEEDYDWQDLREQLEQRYIINKYMSADLFGNKEEFEKKEERKEFLINYINTEGKEVTKVLNREEGEELLKLCRFWSDKFDYVVGNPPYLGQKGNKLVFEKFKNMNFWKLHYERKQDIYYYFFIRGIEALKESGKLGFITPPYWLTANATGKLKQYIKDNSRLLKVYDFGSEKIFDDAQIDGNIFIFTKEKSINEPICICEYDKDKKTFEQYISKFSNDDLTIGMWNIFTNDKEEDVFDKLSHTELGKIATISPGIQTGSDYVSKSHIEKLNLTNVQVNEGIFVISEQEKQSKFEEKDSCYIKPFYKNSQIDKYCSNLYTDKYILITNEIKDIDEYPNIKNHLLKYKVILDNRYRNYALKKADKEGKWYALYGYRPNTNFEGPKIVIPYRSKSSRFSYIDKPYYASIDVFYIDLINDSFNYFYILGIINSKVILYWLDKNCKKKGENFEFYAEPLSNIPIVNVDTKDQQRVADIVTAIIEKKEKIIEIKNYDYIVNSSNFQKDVDSSIKEIIILNGELISIEEDLNKLIYELYKVNDDIKKYIEGYLIDKNRIFINSNNETEVKEEFISGLKTYIEQLFIELIISNYKNEYVDSNEIKEILIKNLNNLEELICFLKGNEETKKSTMVVEDVLNSDCYTWTQYRKSRNERSVDKTFVRYYDNNYYGLAGWSDEIHKQYFMDAIDEYTVNSPNEKKAKDILKLFNELDIEDKEDYVDIIEDKIKKAFS